MPRDSKNPVGSDIIAERLQKERGGKKAPKKKRQSLISFEVTTEPAHHHAPHEPSKRAHKPREAHAERTAKAASAAPRWKRIAVWIVIILLLLLFFTNNYIKNIYIEDLKSANEEFAQAYEEQQARIAELEERLGGDAGGS